MSDNIQGHKRYQGFIKCLGDCGFSMPEWQVLWFSTNDRENLFTLSKDRVLAMLRDNTAVVCYNDQVAVQMMEFCRNNGLQVPDDVSLVGIDDSNLAKICEVPLTSIRHPKQLLGEQVAETLFQNIITPGAQSEGKLFAPKLIERMSSKPPRKRTLTIRLDENKSAKAIDAPFAASAPAGRSDRGAEAGSRRPRE
jgi:GntR family transcriptional regulator of arabinose operon